MEVKGRLIALGALSMIGMFSFRANEGGHFVPSTTETPRLRSFKDADFPRITIKEKDTDKEKYNDNTTVENDPLNNIEEVPLSDGNDPLNNIDEVRLSDEKDPLNSIEEVRRHHSFKDVDVPLRVLMANTTYTPLAEIVMHAECLAQCERRIFDAYIR